MGCLNGRYPLLEILWVSNDFFFFVIILAVYKKS